MKVSKFHSTAMKLRHLALAAFALTITATFAADDESNLVLLDNQNPTIRDLAAMNSDDPAPQSIPLSELGAKASADYKGDAIGIDRTADGARLRSDFQKIVGTVSRTGLVIESTEAGGGRLSLGAEAYGRYDRALKRLPHTGTVEVRDDTVSYVRAGLVEEYSVSADGVRQDFIVLDRPTGSGELIVELALHGACAEAMPTGVKVVLDASCRELAYSRLEVTDATGRELNAFFTVLSPNRLVVRVEDDGAAYPVRIDPTFSDGDWVSLNPGIPGANGSIYDIAVDGSGNLYVCGRFSFIGSTAANNIAKWNGSTWSALGTGTNRDVVELVLDRGNLYAGGNFETAGGVEVNNIAKWNGSTWNALGTGTNGQVSELVLDGSGNLYAGGEFTTAGGLTANRIAKWNGSTWSALGVGVDSFVYALTVDGNGNLYAGGLFNKAGGVTTNYIAKWNGTTWSALGSGMNNRVYALTMDDGGNLYAGGDFTNAGGVTANYVARWNGGTWSGLGSGVNGGIRCLILDGGGSLYAGGDFTNAGEVIVNYIAKWNGSTWSSLGTGMNNSVSALVLDISGDLHAGGHFGNAGEATALCIARWNGSTWTALGSGINTPIHALTVDGSGILYTSTGSSYGGSDGYYISKWDGSRWNPVGERFYGDVYALAVDGSGNLYAGGSFSIGYGGKVVHIAKWNGSAWSVIPTDWLQNSWDYQARVNALVVSNSGHLYVGGYLFYKTNPHQNSIGKVAKWDGSSWTVIGSEFNGSVEDLTLDESGILFAGGGFTTTGGTAVNNIAKWNGSTWSALGTGMNGSVLAMVSDGNNSLYAGGYFTTAGGVTANRIAKWNGITWSALGAGMSWQGGYGGVGSLVVDSRGNLYAGGYFTTAGEVMANSIAKWNGITWSALGSGVNIYDTYDNSIGSIASLAVDAADHLYVGGSFYLAGTTASPHIAQANIGGSTGTATVTNVRAAQIPGSHQVRITYDLDASAPCTVQVYALIDNPGLSLILPPVSLAGDVTGISNNKVSPGTDRSITLTVAETTAAEGTVVKVPELYNIFTKNLKFKVTATP